MSDTFIPNIKSFAMAVQNVNHAPVLKDLKRQGQTKGVMEEVGN